MSLETDFDAPVTVTLAGTTYTLPLLTIDDLISVGRMVLTERKVKAIGALAMQDVSGRSQVSAWFDEAEIDIDDLSKIVQTLSGARKVLAFSIAKGNPGTPPEVILQQIAKAQGWRSAVMLACRVSALFTPPAIQAAPLPNAGSASASSTVDAGTEATSTPSESPSGEPSASIPAV